MATNQNTKRKDKARVVLRKGESQRKDGKYDFRWTSPDGKRHSIYAATLEELREKENDIQRDSLEGIKAEARYVTLNDVFTLWAKVKRGLKDNTFQNYLYLYRQFVESDFGKSKVSALKKSDVKQFYNTLADERGLQISTIDSVHTVLHQVLDMAVIIAGVLVFGMSVSLYAIIAVYVTALVTDTVLEGTKQARAVWIISDKNEQIAPVVMEKMHRGITRFPASGVYTQQEKSVLLCVVSIKQIPYLKEIVMEIDENSFLIVGDVREVMGNGFVQKLQ
jgi:hypothetical protein